MDSASASTISSGIIAFVKGAMVDPVTVSKNIGFSTPVLARRKSSTGDDRLRSRLAVDRHQTKRGRPQAPSKNHLTY